MTTVKVHYCLLLLACLVGVNWRREQNEEQATSEGNARHSKGMNGVPQYDMGVDGEDHNDGKQCSAKLAEQGRWQH